MELEIGQIGSLVIIYVVSLVIHELGHILAALLTHTKIISIHLGYGKTLIKIKNLNIHFLLFGAHVECEIDFLDSWSKIKSVIIAMGGAIANIVVLIVIFGISGLNELGFLVVNIAMVVVSTLPFEGTDMYSLLIAFDFIDE
ncbi:MAG: site-2 protease family protein [Lachnospiraceae bacterium]|nr:site-2 protease family protein [Lachnospiraceae bacterium]